jgi:two-component sensor histidine kinase
VGGDGRARAGVLHRVPALACAERKLADHPGPRRPSPEPGRLAARLGLHAQRRQRAAAQLQHRVKNLFSNINSLLVFSRRGSVDFDDFVRRFKDRLGALERTQTLFGQSEGSGLEVRRMVATELEAHGADLAKKIEIKGPALIIDRTTAQALAMAIHELATNALKHGALAHQDGRIYVDWATLEDEAPSLFFRWRETGVPLDGRDRKKGFGSELIEQSVPYMVGGTSRLEFLRNGVRCVMEVPLRQGEAGP